jgi:hypothetical protein
MIGGLSPLQLPESVPAGDVPRVQQVLHVVSVREDEADRHADERESAAHDAQERSVEVGSRSTRTDDATDKEGHRDRRDEGADALTQVVVTDGDGDEDGEVQRNAAENQDRHHVTELATRHSQRCDREAEHPGDKRQQDAERESNRAGPALLED